MKAGRSSRGMAGWERVEVNAMYARGLWTERPVRAR
jgi:hypothetical protein